MSKFALFCLHGSVESFMEMADGIVLIWDFVRSWMRVSDEILCELCRLSSRAIDHCVTT